MTEGAMRRSHAAVPGVAARAAQACTHRRAAQERRSERAYRPFVVGRAGHVPGYKQDPNVAAALGVTRSTFPTRGLGLVVRRALYPCARADHARRRRRLMVGRRRQHRRHRRPTTDRPADGRDAGSRRSRRRSRSTSARGTAGATSAAGSAGPAFTTELEGRPLPDQESRSKTINYGGGARWFVKKHLACRWTCASTPSTRRSRHELAARLPAHDARGVQRRIALK